MQNRYVKLLNALIVGTPTSELALSVADRVDVFEIFVWSVCGATGAWGGGCGRREEGGKNPLEWWNGSDRFLSLLTTTRPHRTDEMSTIKFRFSLFFLKKISRKLVSKRSLVSPARNGATLVFL